MLLKGLKKSVLSKLKILWEIKKNIKNELKNKWHKKRMNGQFACEMPEETDKDLSWRWLVQRDLKVQTEATISAAQEQALSTNYTKNEIDKTLENLLCRMCGERGETVQHIICECKKPEQREYKRRHDTSCKIGPLEIGREV